jgi:O-glycosyl hydrolase
MKPMRKAGAAILAATLAASLASCGYVADETPGGQQLPPWTSTSSKGILVPASRPSDPAGGAGQLTVDPAATRQSIEGFGGSNAWTGLPSGAAGTTVVKLLFSKSQGIGLTILRNRIPFRENHYVNASTSYDDNFIVHAKGDAYKYVDNADGTRTFSLNWGNWDLGNTRSLIQAIQALGADADAVTMMSTPWTPPNNATTSWKVGVPDPVKAPDVGGSLDPAHYADYADLLADYALGFRAQMGVGLAALSIQNEPNWAPSYESCAWTADQIAAFLKVLAGRFAMKGVDPGLALIAPEDMNFKEDLVLPSFQDGAASGALTVVGVHQYDQGAKPDFAAQWLSSTKGLGKRLWETEVSDGSANDSSIVDGLHWARVLHADLTIAEVNAFCYWWLWAGSGSKGGLIGLTGSTVVDNKRLYTLGQYSRFVRPGWLRLSAETDPAPGVQASAFRSPSTKEIAVVLINGGSASASVLLRPAAGSSFAALSTWRTSAGESLASLGALGLASGGASASVSLPAQSVTTVYGTLN